MFVPGAVGGTSFWNHRWNPGDDLYDNLVALTKTVLAEHPDWRLRAMLFQGFETDAKNGMLATTFRRALDRFVRGIRADLRAPELPIVFGELPPAFVDGHPDRAAIRDELQRATTRLPYIAVAPSRSPSVADDDGLHYSTAGLLLIGGRYAAALAAAEANALARSPADAAAVPGHGSALEADPGFPAPPHRIASGRISWQAEIMPTAPIAPYDERVTHQVRVLIRAVNRTPGRTRLYLLAGAIVLVIIATAVMQVQLNAWNRPFYDAIERRDLAEFLRQLGVFFVIAGILLVLNVAQTGFNQLIRVRLRELATKDLIGNWMTRKRAARISRAGEIGVNPDQRIQADAQNLTELTTDLGVGLVQSSVLLASFIGVLWILSEGVVIPIGGRDLAIPGYMVWAALLYALSGSLISWRVGRPLVRLGADRYAREADFRFALVQGSERAEGIALSNGEAQTPGGARGEPRHARRHPAPDRHGAGAPDLGDRRLRLGRRWCSRSSWRRRATSPGG